MVAHQGLYRGKMYQHNFPVTNLFAAFLRVVFESGYEPKATRPDMYFRPEKIDALNSPAM
jgi:hypothetical protein